MEDVKNWNFLSVLESDFQKYKNHGTPVPIPYNIVPPNGGVWLLAESGNKLPAIFDPRINAARPMTKNNPTKGMAPANNDLHLLYDHLQNKDLPIVIVDGLFGTAKTSTVMAHAISHFYDRGFKMYLSKPHVPVGRSNGHLPGSLGEKVAPEFESFYQYLNRFTDRQFLQGTPAENYISSGQVEIAPFEYIRGRDFPNAWVVVDESQNLTLDEVITVASRVAEGSKLILLGDSSPWQKDRPNAGGLAKFIKLFQNEGIVGSVEMKTERHVLRGRIAKTLARVLLEKGTSI